jgi:acetoin utilization deacetylase AcuC-like enzyme
MSRTAVVLSPVFKRHDPGRGHPESPRRVTVIAKELESMKERFSDRLGFIPPERASLEDVELVHAPEYISLVRAVCRAGGGFLDSQDTVASADTFEVALYAVGGTLKAVNLVMERSFENAFAIVRPPGHHAEKFRALGFCIFNNVAIAAQYLTEKLGLSRVLVLDVDAHHGNGTQQRFYDTSRVLYISLHEDPTEFPGTGFTGEIGSGEGLGYNVNVSFPYGTGDHAYLRAIEEIVMPIASQYEPEFILVSAGFDGHHSDPVGNLSLSSSCIARVYETAVDLALRTCQKRLVCVLEGGYNLSTIGCLAASALAKMMGVSLTAKVRMPTIKRSSGSEGEKSVEEAKKALRRFWDLG